MITLTRANKNEDDYVRVAKKVKHWWSSVFIFSHTGWKLDNEEVRGEKALTLFFSKNYFKRQQQ